MSTYTQGDARLFTVNIVIGLAFTAWNLRLLPTYPFPLCCSCPTAFSFRHLDAGRYERDTMTGTSRSPLLTSHSTIVTSRSDPNFVQVLLSFKASPPSSGRARFNDIVPPHFGLRYRHLFTSRMDTMVQFRWQDDLLSVARFIADCFKHSQSGGGPS
jgi:hypothetical protein